MSVSLTSIRDHLLPGLIAMAEERYAYSLLNWRDIYGSTVFVPSKPHIWVPKLTLPEAAVVGAAATIIKNPIVTRRFWAGWKI